MKRTLIVAAAMATLVLNAPAVFAQGVGVQVGPVGAGITFAPEQRTRVREYVTRERIAPVTVELAGNRVISTIGYNGMSPGPVLKMKEGVPVTIDVINETDVPAVRKALKKALAGK